MARSAGTKRRHFDYSWLQYDLIDLAVNEVLTSFGIRRWSSLKRGILLCSLVLLCSVATAQTGRITARQAKDHIGEVKTVCRKVASARYAPRGKGQPTFLNLDEPYPSQIFTILIWGENRSKFGEPESRYRDADVCVTGKITEYRSAPEIVAN